VLFDMISCPLWIRHKSMTWEKSTSLIGQSFPPRKKTPWIVRCDTMDCNVYNIIQSFQIFLKLRDPTHAHVTPIKRKRKKPPNQGGNSQFHKMIDASRYLVYLQEQQALICRGCKYCLQPNGVERHLQRKHSVISLKVRKELVNYAESLTLRNPSEVITPVTVIPAFDCLEVIRGFRCSACNCLYGTPRSIEEHCRTHRRTMQEGSSHN